MVRYRTFQLRRRAAEELLAELEKIEKLEPQLRDQELAKIENLDSTKPTASTMASDNDNPFSQQVADPGSPCFASSSDGGAMGEIKERSE